MTIAVHISLTGNHQDLLQNFNYRCFTILAGKYPEQHFIFIFDRPYDPELIRHDNITPVLASPQIKNRLIAYYWYNFKIPGLLDKYNADLFVTAGINVSLRASCRQCLVLQDLGFLQKENLLSRTDSRYLKRYFKRFVAKTTYIAVPAAYLRETLSILFPASKNKIKVIGYGLNSADDNQSSGTERTKEKYTEGKEYFIAHITNTTAANTIILLKAFSLFKKRQLSNMKLLLLMSSSQKESPIKDLATYKFRDEVKLVWPENEEESASIASAAYAAIYLPAMDTIEDEGWQAIKNGVPLITRDTGLCNSLYGQAALFTATAEKNIAEKMMLIYKDEGLRADLVNEGKALTANFSWDNTAARLWEAIQETSEQ